MQDNIDQELLSELSQLMKSTGSSSNLRWNIKDMVSQIINEDWTYVWDTWNWMKHWEWIFQYNNWDRYVWEWRRDKKQWQWTMYYDNWNRYDWQWIDDDEKWKFKAVPIGMELMVVIKNDNRICKKDWKYWLIDREWKILISFENDMIINSLISIYKDGFTILSVEKDNKYYITDNFWKKINNNYYNYVGLRDYKDPYIEEIIAIVELNWKYWLIDSQLKEIIPCIYDKIDIPKEDEIKLLKVMKNWKYWLADFKWYEQWPCIYDYIDFLTDDFKWLMIVKKNWKYWIINFSTWEELYECMYKYIAFMKKQWRIIIDTGESYKFYIKKNYREGAYYDLED